MVGSWEEVLAHSKVSLMIKLAHATEGFARRTNRQEIGGLIRF